MLVMRTWAREGCIMATLAEEPKPPARCRRIGDATVFIEALDAEDNEKVTTLDVLFIRRGLRIPLLPPAW